MKRILPRTAPTPLAGRLWLALLLVATLGAGCKGKTPAAKSSTAATGTGPSAATDGGDTGPDAALGLASATAEPAMLARDAGFDASIRRGVLPNGLTYYVARNQTPKARAEMWLAVNAGSVLEDDDQRGLAHFVEHMAFNGTTKFPKQTIVATIEKFGMKFGADLNAYTSFDETVYQLKVPTDVPSDLATGLDILREWAGEVKFDAAEVEKERGVVLEEWRLKRTAEMRLIEQALPVVFAGSPYGQRWTIGTAESIKTATRDALVRFYRDWYRPDLMAVIVVGDIDVAAMEAEIKARFGTLKPPAKARPRLIPAVDFKAAPTFLPLQDSELTVDVVAVLDKRRPLSERTVGDYRAVLVRQLFALIMNERLGDLHKKPDSPLLFPPMVSEDEFPREATLVAKAAVPKKGKALDALRLVVRESARVATHGVTASELGRAKREVLQSYEHGVAELEARKSADLAAELSRNFLTGEFVPGPHGELELVKTLLPTIGPSDLHAHAKAFDAGRSRSFIVAGKEKLPTEAEVVQAVAEAQRDVEKLVEKAVPSSLLPSWPAPGTIAGERSDAAHGVTEWKLSNGMTVVLKPTDFEPDTIEVSGFAKGGHSRAPDAKYWTAAVADEIVAGGGVGDLDSATLAKFLAGRDVSVGVTIADVHERVYGRASRRDAETMFQLLHARLTAPRRDETAFLAWKEATRALLAERLASPDSRFGYEFEKLSWGGHLRHRPLELADLETITLDGALAFFRERFADVSGFTMIIAGNFEPKAMRPLVEKYLASLPGAAPTSGAKPRTWVDDGAKRAQGRRNHEVVAGHEPKSSVAMRWWVPAAWSQELQRDVEVLELALQIRLIDTLREELGGIYGARSSVDVERRLGPALTLQIAFGCDPKNVDKLQAATVKELRRMAAQGLSKAHWDRIHAQLRRSREEQLRSNAWWIDQLETSYEFGEPLAELLSVDATVARATNAHLRALVKTLESAPNQLAVELLPER